MDLPDLDEDERWSFSLAVGQSGPGAILIVLADAEYASNHATGPGNSAEVFLAWPNTYRTCNNEKRMRDLVGNHSMPFATHGMI
jgi:hypothetical protein